MEYGYDSLSSIGLITAGWCTIELIHYLPATNLSLPWNYLVIPLERGIHKVMNSYYMYIMANKPNGTLYIGSTNNLVRRVYEHKNDLIDGFTKRYGVHRLVYYEETSDYDSARLREKQMKKWNRQWKINRIIEMNPDWEDLYDSIL